MRYVLGIAAVVFALSLATSWGGGPPEADLTFLGSGEHNHLDPQRMSWSHDIRLAQCLYEPLLSLDYATFEHGPGVAERWEVSEDGLTYTFHLRQDARWSNGDPVTAHDFVYAWRRALLPDLAADYSSMLFCIRGAEAFFNKRAADLEQYAKLRTAFGSSGDADAAEAIYENAKAYFHEMVGIAAPDDHTLVVELHRPTAYFLDLVAFATYMPNHAASVEASVEVDPASGMAHVLPSYWTAAVCNGPYRIAKRVPQQYVYLEANEQYWNHAATQNRSLLELIVSDPNLAIQKYERGEANFHPAVPGAGELAKLIAASAEQRNDIVRQPMAGTYFYNFYCAPTLADGSPNPLADVRVRRALSLAIDRQSLVDHVTGVGQPVALSYIPVGALADYDPPVEHGITFDPEAAKKLLDEAGYPNGQGLDGLSILYNTGNNHEGAAQAIRRMWTQHLGVTVELEGVPVKVFSQRLKGGDYTIARAAWFGDYPDPTTWLQKMTTTDGNNDCKWSNARFDALLDEADQMPRGEERTARLRDAEAILLEEQPMALLYQYVLLYLIDDKLEGLKPNAWNRFRFEDVKVNE